MWASAAWRALLLCGWAVLVLLVWWGVPYVVAFAVEPIPEGPVAGPSGAALGSGGEGVGERLRPLLHIVLLLWACAAAAGLSWLLLINGGVRGAAAFFATLVAALYLIETPYATALGVEPGATLGGVREATHTIVSLAVSWLFTLALGGVLLRAERAIATTGPAGDKPAERHLVMPLAEDPAALVVPRLRALASEADDDAYARTLVAICADALGADRCSIFFVHPAEGEIRSRSGTGLNVPIRLPIGAGLVGQVARSGKPLVIADAYNDPRFDQGTDARLGYRTTSVLVLPLVRRREVFGVLQALNKRAGAFGPADQALLERIIRLARPRLERIYAREAPRRRSA